MTPCLDIHTHRSAPCLDAVVCVDFDAFSPMVGQRYSLGIHPWATENEIPTEKWELFEAMAEREEVVAIGECGIDKLRGAPLYRQMLVFKRQVDISEKIEKPLIIHDVKAHDIIMGLKRDLKPKQKWLVHGFRGKPETARMLTGAGIFLSFGEKFNPAAPSAIPREFVLAETDESQLPIGEIIARISSAMGQDAFSLIESNTSFFLGL